ncbi:Transposase [Ceratobasidium sp. AG-Ba]|nr:Transposase [Ceratobasidium sp. AG-Ba]
MPKTLPAERLNSVLSLLDAGHTHSEIMDRVPITSGTISKIAKKHRPNLPKSAGGRPRKLSPGATRYAVRLVTNNNNVSTRQATQRLCALTGQSIHPKTVKCALKSAGLVPVKKQQKPQLTPEHMETRLNFAKIHKDWTVEDWRRVLWSDETKINRLGSDGIHWGWKRKGEGLSNRLVVPSANFGGGSIMFWGCFSWQGVGIGCRLLQNLTKEGYIDILENEFLRSLAALGLQEREVIFQQDNASSHKAHICLNWFEHHGVELMEWPSMSPDLNPIENMWAELKRRLGEYETPPGGILELWDRVKSVWCGFDEEYYQKLIESMPKRMALVIKRKGDSIPY